MPKSKDGDVARGAREKMRNDEGNSLVGPPNQMALVQLKELEEKLSATRAATICALAQLLDLKDLQTGCHSTRLAEWAVRVARELGVDEALVSSRPYRKGLPLDEAVRRLLQASGTQFDPDVVHRFSFSS